VLWTNWCGLEHAYPERRLAPASESELVQALPAAPTPIRPVGAGHSFTALVPTSGTMLSLDRMAGLAGHDAATHSARVLAGTRLAALGPRWPRSGRRCRTCRTSTSNRWPARSPPARTAPARD
jgi:FAD/FMN-containing dehydrogenase